MFCRECFEKVLFTASVMIGSGRETPAKTESAVIVLAEVRTVLLRLCKESGWNSIYQYSRIAGNRYGAEDIKSRCSEGFSEGKSVRQIMREMGISQGSVTRYRRLWLKENDLPLCECGKRCDHKGWCSFKYAQSPKRQAALKALHEKQRSA